MIFLVWYDTKEEESHDVKCRLVSNNKIDKMKGGRWKIKMDRWLKNKEVKYGFYLDENKTNTDYW